MRHETVTWTKQPIGPDTYRYTMDSQFKKEQAALDNEIRQLLKRGHRLLSLGYILCGMWFALMLWAAVEMVM